MSNQRKPKPENPETAEAPKSVAEIAKESVDGVEAAFDTAAGVAHETVQAADAAAGAFKARAADLQMKAIENFQANMGATFAFARKAFEMRDPAEFFKLQQNFAKERFEALAAQTAEMNSLAVALARDTFKPAQESFVRGFASFAKPFAA
jgi:phasin family protein